MPRYWIPIAIFGFFGLGILIWLWPDEDIPQRRVRATEATSKKQQDSGSVPTTQAGKTIQQRLIDAGWTMEAAEQVVKLNEDWFQELKSSDPKWLEEQLDSLERLGTHEGLMVSLENYPEMAGLLATVDNPEKIVQVLENADEDHRLTYLNIFMRHPSRLEANLLASILPTDGDQIHHLFKRGLFGAEVMYLFPREDLGSQEYARWLNEVMAQTLGKSDDEVASFMHLVMVQGVAIRRRMIDNVPFREQFRSQLWPRFARVAAIEENPMELFLDTPGVWDVLAMAKGEELLTKRGMAPVIVLYGKVAVSPDLQDKVADLLLAGDEVTFEALVDPTLRGEPEFQKLLKRPLPPEILATAVDQVFSAGPNRSQVLKKFSPMDDTQLTKALGPPEKTLLSWVPGYTHVVIVGKLIDGETVDRGEWLEAGIDTISFFFPPAKGGAVAVRGGTKVITQTLMKTAEKTAVKRLGNKAAGTLAKNATRREINRWGVTGLLSQVQTSFKTIAKHAVVDITDPVRFFYKHSHLGNRLFGRITGLDARIFMRAEGRVFLHLERVPAAFVNRFLDQCWDKFQDEGKEVTQAYLKAAWKKHASAWFLLNVNDRLEQIPSSPNLTNETPGRKK